MKALVQEAYAVGGKPFVHIFDYAVEGALVQGADAEHMEEIASYELERMRDMDAYIDIRATTNISAWHNVSDEAQKRYRQYYWAPSNCRNGATTPSGLSSGIPTTPWPSWPASPPRSMRTSTSGPAWWDYDKMGRAMKPLQDLMAKTDRVASSLPARTSPSPSRESPASGCTATGTSPTARSTPLP